MVYYVPKGDSVVGQLSSIIERWAHNRKTLGSNPGGGESLLGICACHINPTSNLASM